MPGEGSNRTVWELDSWTSYSSCKWIDNPELSTSAAGPLASFPDLIPDSEPNNFATTSLEEIGSGEEDLASVPSTVKVGSPGSTDGGGGDPVTRPTMSPGGT